MSYEIIKEKCTHDGNGTFVVRSNCHAKALSFILELYESAKEDFPALKHEDCRVVQYGGRSYSGTMGIEFDAANYCATPPMYTKINQLELTR